MLFRKDYPLAIIDEIVQWGRRSSEYSSNLEYQELIKQGYATRHVGKALPMNMPNMTLEVYMIRLTPKGKKLAQFVGGEF